MKEQKLLSKNNDNSWQNSLQYLHDKNLPKLNDDQCTLFEKKYNRRGSKTWIEENNKSRKGSLTEEFYEAFWGLIRVLLLSCKMAFLIKALWKCIEKNDRDKRFIKNWRRISLLNVHVKLISKYFQAELKTHCQIWFRLIKICYK